MCELDVGAADHLYRFNDVVSVFLEAFLKIGIDGQHGCGAVRITGVNAHCVDIFNEADGDHLVFSVPDNFELKLFPPQDRFFDQNLADETCRKTACGDRAKLLDIINQPSPRAAHAVCRAKHDRIAQFFGHFFRILDAVHRLAFRQVDPKSIHGFFERCPVFSALDGIDVHPNNFDTVFFKNAGFGQLG